MKAIITGSTGMVGKGVLLECLDHPEVEEVLVLNRRPIGLKHPELKEVIVNDYADLASQVLDLNGYNACFHCMGVSVVGLSEEKYTAITYEATSILSELLYGLNPDLVFNYVSGTGTDSSEKGSLMWARVKGRAENKILNQGFKDAYAFRPGAIIPERGIKSSTLMYNLFYIISRPLFPLLRRMDSITTSSRLGQAMINSVLRGTPLKHLENTDINSLATIS
ncbi:MAG: NAD-dependent epimerase/dehydratase family protein [Flavobacteriales bacterium]|nr:NAD-dependent epimerase/dehydratase family protein [Flavobacteriales bacterium]